MKKLGNAGLLGINKPVEYGGLGLDYKYQGKGYLEWINEVVDSSHKLGLSQVEWERVFEWLA